MCNILGKLIFNFAIENLIRSSLRLGKFLRGLVQMGLEWICFFLRFSVVFTCCLCFCVLSFFCFGFVSCLFPFFPLIFVFFSLFSLFFASSFLFIRFKRFECFLHISRQLLSIVPQSSATGKLQKHEKRGYFAPTSSTPTLSETFQAMLLFQDSDPMTQALGWPMIRERIPLRKATGPLQKKFPKNILM